MADPFASIDAELADLRERHLWRSPRVIEPNLLNFSSNDYLGLASHPSLKAAAQTAAAEHGFGAGAARLISGTRPPHAALEQALATWLGTDAALLFNSGYHANLGVLSALLSAEDQVFSDALNHASLIDGCRLSRASVFVYRHLELDDLERQLAAAPPARRRVIVSEGLFSMDGDRAPIARLSLLAKRFEALLFIDDAHAFGAAGPRGRGTTADLAVDIRVGTFGKAFGSFGAFVAADQSIIDLLAMRARSFIFTTALPPPVVAASAAALALTDGTEGDALRSRLAANVARVAQGLTKLGLPVSDAPTHIFPLLLSDGRPESAVTLSQHLRERGLFLQAIRPPTVPRGTARLRLSLSAAHTAADLDALCAGLAAISPALAKIS